MLLVHMGSPAEASRFFDSRWPEARAVSDPDRILYRGFDLGRARLGQVFGLSVWKAAFKVMGHGVGKPVGETSAMGGTFGCLGTSVVAADLGDHVGHTPDYARLNRSLEEAQLRARSSA